MADIVIQPVWQVLDGNGEPVSGAKVSFFDSGTTTPQTVYTDTGLSVPHASPVVADANGVMPPVYTSGALAKAVIKTSADVTIKTVDPVPKSPAGTTGASQVSFSPTAEIPVLNVQSAIEAVQDNLEASSSAFAKTLLDDVNAEAMRATLGMTDGTAGQVLAMNTAGTDPAYRAPIVWGTPVASTSGSAIDFTGIPAWATVIYVAFSEVSLSGTNSFLVQIGDAGGVEATGYISSNAKLDNGASVAVDNSTAGFIAGGNIATHNMSGIMTLALVKPASFDWVASHSCKYLTTGVSTGGGAKALSATLDRVRITVSGVNTFDNGTINVGYS